MFILNEQEAGKYEEHDLFSPLGDYIAVPICYHHDGMFEGFLHDHSR